MYKTAESVAVGHPDKVCDQIADAILDECLTSDPRTRSAVEVMGGHGVITITGELTTQANVDPEQIARRVYRECGYSDDAIDVVLNIARQSLEIGAGVDNDGAGDQGIMMGYATSETPEMLPLEVALSRRLAQALGVRDGKTQVSTEGGKVVSFITSACGDMNDQEEKEFLQAVREIISPCLSDGVEFEKAWQRNPNGRWTVGGFEADAGLTGRKIVVDNYGPHIPVGGGAFSGKDATKVDRSAAYMARKIACDYVRRGAGEVRVALAYAIGRPDPVMAAAEVDGVHERVSGYDLRPRAIIEQLNLTDPQYHRTARYGHFGRGYAWD